MGQIRKGINSPLTGAAMGLAVGNMVNKIRDSTVAVEAEAVTSTIFSGQHLLLVLSEVVHKILMHKVDTCIKLHQSIHRMAEKLQRRKEMFSDPRKTYRLKIRSMKISMRR